MQYWEILWQLIPDDGEESPNSSYLCFLRLLCSLAQEAITLAWSSFMVQGPVLGHQVEVLPEIIPDQIPLISKLQGNCSFSSTIAEYVVHVWPRGNIKQKA